MKYLIAFTVLLSSLHADGLEYLTRDKQDIRAYKSERIEALHHE